MRVTDTGPGIAPDRQESLFAPFTQADASTSRRFGGTGLGLAISRQLARGLGGNLTLTSVLGEGARFEVALPFDEDADRKVTESRLLEGRRLLVVEALPLQRRLVREMLVRQGARVEVVSQAAEACGELKLHSFEVVVLSEASFDEVFASNPQTPTVLLSRGTGRKADKAIPVVTYPFTNQALAQAVLAALGQQPAPVLQQDAVSGGEVRQRLKVLVADDNLVNQRIARAMLEKLGCVVTLVENGELAVEAHRQERWDLIFMDCQMPELDGYDATMRIRARETAERLPRTPVVAMTANVMAEDRTRGVESGMDDLVAKPTRLDDLRGALLRWTS